MSTLIDLIQHISDLEQAILENNGEITEVMEKAIAEVNLDLAEKIDATDIVLSRIKMSSGFWMERADKLYAVAKGLEELHKQLNNHIKNVMAQSGKTELIGNDVCFKLAKTKPALEVDEAKLDPKYFRVKVAPDQEKIRTDIELGVPVEGARLRDSFALRTTVNKRRVK
jgi:hypothetical protein